MQDLFLLSMVLRGASEVESSAAKIKKNMLLLRKYCLMMTITLMLT